MFVVRRLGLENDIKKDELIAYLLLGMTSSNDARPTGDITTWFINAKRSLTSISLCTRANDLVDAARVALQEGTVIASRCVFLRRALQDQLSVVKQINEVMHSSRETARCEFQVRLLPLLLLPLIFF